VCVCVCARVFCAAAGLKLELLQVPGGDCIHTHTYTHTHTEHKHTHTQNTLVQPYFAAPDFNYDAARKASGNVAGLCNWAAAMCTYHEVAKVVEPKIAKLREAEVGCRACVVV